MQYKTKVAIVDQENHVNTLNQNITSDPNSLLHTGHNLELTCVSGVA